MSIAPLERTTTTPNLLPRRDRGIRPNTVTEPSVRLKVRVVRRKRASILDAIALRAVLFTGIFSATYMGFAVSGQVAVEKARHEEITAKNRAEDAKRAESEIRMRVDALTSSASVQQWAAARDYIAPGADAKKQIPPKA